jgi:hypothetical protein
MPIELPPAGTRLLSRRHKGLVIEAMTVDDDSYPGGRAVVVRGVRYGTLSAAAKAVCGHEANGWIWWRLEDGRPAAELRKR